jgi:predicted HTH transcriptional regulator
MIVIRADDRANYLKILHQCDLLTGKIPSDAANATKEQTQPLIHYLKTIVEKKLIAVVQLTKGEITEIIESTEHPISIESGQNEVVRKGGQKRWSEVLDLINENPSISRKELSERLNINPSAVQKHIQKLKSEGFIKRIGGDRGGHWEIMNKENSNS